MYCNEIRNKNGTILFKSEQNFISSHNLIKNGTELSLSEQTCSNQNNFFYNLKKKLIKV